MKSLLLALILSLVFAVTGAVAETYFLPKDSDMLPDPGELTFIVDDPAAYQVIFTVKYNSVSPEEAARLAEQIMLNHSDGCRVQVKIEKIGNDGLILTGSDNVVWTEDAGDTLTIPGTWVLNTD